MLLVKPLNLMGWKTNKQTKQQQQQKPRTWNDMNGKWKKKRETTTKTAMTKAAPKTDSDTKITLQNIIHDRK